jgi:uncharacterized protein
VASEQYDDDESERTPYWVAFAAVLFGFAISSFLTILVALIGAGFGSSATNPTPAVNDINNFLFDGSFVLAALYFTVVRGSKGRIDFGYRRIAWTTGVGAVVLAGVGYYVVSLIYQAIAGVHGTDRLPSDLGVGRSAWADGAVALSVCAVAPMAEEFFFRGFLFGVLRRMRIRLGKRELGPWVAAAVVGVLFGLAHYDSAQPQFLVPLGFLGFVLCILRWRTGSLYPCMALHAINNSVALGVNESLGWNAGEIVALTVGALAVIALVTGPLSRGRPSVTEL